MKRPSSIAATNHTGQVRGEMSHIESGFTRAEGFSLLEVLITMLVLIFGLMGLAKMGAVAISNNNGAYIRSQVVLQAHDMAERMYANPDGVQNGQYIISSGSKGTDHDCLTSSSDPGSLSCSSQQIAEFDAYQWNSANERLLPGGKGEVKKHADDVRYIIELVWNENELDGVDEKRFSFEVEPLPAQP